MGPRRDALQGSAAQRGAGHRRFRAGAAGARGGRAARTGGRATERLPGALRPATPARPVALAARARRRPRRSSSLSAESRAARASSTSFAAVSSLEGVQLAIAGPDDGHGLLPELLALRDRLGAGGRVHLLGAVESPLDLYGDADVFALPSAHENFGMVAAEAAAAGTASVVSDRCGVAEVMRDRGALVIPYGEAPLQEALARLLGDGGLRAELGRGGREVASGALAGRTSPGCRPRSTSASCDRPRGRHPGSTLRRRRARADRGVRARRARARPRAGSSCTPASCRSSTPPRSLWNRAGWRRRSVRRGAPGSWLPRRLTGTRRSAPAGPTLPGSARPSTRSGRRGGRTCGPRGGSRSS